jgi:hypothetical protein
VSEQIKARHFFASGPNRIRDAFVSAFEFGKALAESAAVEIMVRPVKSRRSLAQNAKLWAMLADISRQVEWPVNGVMSKLDAEEWKAIFTATVRQEVRMAAGISGGVVMLGRSTRKMSVQEMTDVIEFMHAFCAERGVVLGEQARMEIPEHWETE